MPAYLVHRAEEMVTAAGLTMRSLPILLLGVTYKPNTADQRETPAAPITRQLRQLGAVVSFYDPYVSHWQVDGIPVAGATDLSQALQHNDVAILLQDHEAFDFSLIAAQAHHLLDTCGRISGPHVATL
jgi:UDP-N-acetyl-D-mannosaminuronate dehydrogenase